MDKKRLDLFYKEFEINADKYYKYILLFIIVAYFLSELGAGLVKGGRWDLYQHIAMADRFLDGKGFYYSTVEASSPYFPGVAFLAVLVGKLFNPYRDYILLVIASLIGALFFLFLIKISNKYVKNKWIPLMIMSAYMFTMFDSYRSYMNEFKADTSVLLIGYLICCIIDKIEKNEEIKFLQLAGLFVLAFVMGITKQQALYVDIGIGLYVVFQKEIKIPTKIKILVPLVLAGLIDIGIVFSIPGVEILAIKNLSDMPYHSIKSIIAQMGACFKGNWLFFVFLFVFAFLWIKKMVKLDDFAWKWMMISLVFGAGQIIGGWKLGGNAGNYEVGMVNFVPFTMIGAGWVFEEYIAEKKKGQTVIISMACAICITCVYLAGFGLRRIPRIILKVRNDNEASAYLSERFGGEEIMYYSNQYMQVTRSAAIPGMDIYTTPSNIAEYANMQGEYIKEQKYKYLYVNAEDFKKWDESSLEYEGIETHSYENLNTYYELLEDEDMPESLQGQLYVAK